jgi:hypothetical protein
MGVTGAADDACGGVWEAVSIGPASGILGAVRGKFGGIGGAGVWMCGGLAGCGGGVADGLAAAGGGIESGGRCPLGGGGMEGAGRFSPGRRTPMMGRSPRSVPAAGVAESGGVVGGAGGGASSAGGVQGRRTEGIVSGAACGLEADGRSSTSVGSEASGRAVGVVGAAASAAGASAASEAVSVGPASVSPGAAVLEAKARRHQLHRSVVVLSIPHHLQNIRRFLRLRAAGHPGFRGRNE